MYFLFSGEGPTDLGQCADDADECTGSKFKYGPMTVIVDRIITEALGDSFLEGEHFGYVSKQRLIEQASEMKTARKKSLGLPGKNHPKETQYFFHNARAFSRIALKRQRQIKEDVIAILFRDSDGTSSAGRGLWNDKRQSMLDGFDHEGFPRGVPMIPKPKSEAWIICALKPNPYDGCAALEQRSGNDRSPKSLKKELAGILKGKTNRDALNALVEGSTFNVKRIEMPSFNAFRERLITVISMNGVAQ